MNKKLMWGLLTGLMVSLLAMTSYAISNPAAAYAEKLGYLYSLDGDSETVTVAPGVVLDAWDFYRGKVGSEYAYGAQYGYDTVNRTVEADGVVRSYAVCVSKTPLKTGEAEEISMLDLMKQNGEPLWVDPDRQLPADLEDIMKTAPLKTFPKGDPPASWDWRNVGGSSYIGSVRNQGSCGSCYAFGAAAAAEGAFNYVQGLTGGSCVDFSEAYIAWCLGEYGAYSSHFSGCDGADYDYQELEALTVEGICGESQMPYNSGSDPGSCTYSGTTTVFQSWARVDYADITAIKNAIMTYGVVDAAVYVDDDFSDYSSGVHDDSNNTCDDGWYTTSNHAISLVGWDDNPSEGGGGVWILRNSWGSSWGESGYMRIRYDAAVVHCAVCYMVYDDPPETAPVFGTNPGPLGATTGVARAFTVSATGNPTPTLALKAQTASSGYSFVPGTGVLTYTPPTGDVGARTFTFTASNTQGVVTQVVSVSVSLAAPASPATIWASATNQTDFTAAWSSVSGATSYRLDVGTNATFTGGSGGAATDLLISEYIEGSSNNKAVEIFNGTGSSVDLSAGSYTLRLYANGSTSPTTITLSGTVANGAVFVVANSSANAAILAQADLSTGSLGFNGNDVVALAKSGVNIDVMGTIGSSADFGADVTKVRLESISEGTTTYSTSEWTDSAADTTAYLGSHTYAGGGEPSYVAGYSNLTVSGTSQSVSGLSAGQTYYFRARAVNAGGSSANTSVANVTTLATLSAPVFGANPGPVATTAGVERIFTVSASGVPSPALALQSQAASSGYSFNAGAGELTYTPPQADAGTRTFTFSASNSQGTASQVVTVNVTAATAPAFTGGAGPYSTTAGVEVAFTVTVSGTPAATLALQSQTASSGYSFTPASGAFTYTPPVGDIGTPTFTFTAANAAGTVTQVTSVSVSAAPTAPDAPALVWASGTNATDFTAAWSSSSGATSYRLDVGTNAAFTGGGAGGASRTNDCADIDGGSASSYLTRVWTNNTDVVWTAYKGRTDQTVNGNPSICVRNEAGAYLTGANIPAGIGTLSFVVQQMFSGTGGELTIYVNGSQVDTFAYDTTVQTAMVANINVSSVTSLVISNNTSARPAINALVWTDYGASGPAFVPGYEDRTVAGTSQSVTGLVAESTYYFRARAVNGVGTSGNSPTGSVTTLAESAPGTAPTMGTIPAQVVGVGTDLFYTVTATEPDLDTVTFACTSLVDEADWAFDTDTGDFLFEPTAAEVGTNFFSFTATDKDGTSPAVQMTVRVNSAAPTNAFEEWVEDEGQDPGNGNFDEGADYDGDGMTTEQEYLADTDPANSNNVLKLEGNYVTAGEAGEDTGQIRFSFPASPNRYYQMEYCTDITNQVSVVVTNLGWGTPDGGGNMTCTNESTGTWYGVIRALMQQP